MTMAYPEIKAHISRIIFNVPGWRTHRKIVVIESDDWGSIRMPSLDVYQKCLQAGYPVDKISYERFDSLASEDDLELLFGLLSSFQDSRGNPPVITANSLVANPDFDQMKAHGFESYYHEPITETFNKYPRHGRNMAIWKQGMEAKVFHPQYHGREHVNVSLLMDALRRGDEAARFGVSHGMPGCIPRGPEAQGNPYVEAMRFSSPEDKENKLKIFMEGLDLFADLFGYTSESIIPPNYTWSPDFNPSVWNHGVRFIQGLRLMAEPVPGGPSKQHTIYMGKQNSLGQHHLVRNAIFEPSLHGLGINDPVKRCLAEMKIAFSLHKPCIITSHRINYVGFLDPENRDRTLTMLRQVLLQALRRWPDIEFMTSDQLGRIIEAADNQTRYM
jgi:hypothetical protein